MENKMVKKSTFIILIVYQIILSCFQPPSVDGAFADNGVKLESFNKTSSCPEKVVKSGIYLYGDQKLCNVYHECNCTVGTNSSCVLLRTNLCPIGQVFSNLTDKCEFIEAAGCDTSYLQWVDNKNNQTGGLMEKNDLTSLKLSNTLDTEGVNIPTADINYFVCPPGSNSRFADPYICNIFHVCVTRGDQTYDQPFLCPYSSVFRVFDANTMYCDKRKESDCVGTAFYKGTEEDAKVQTSTNLLLNYTTNKSLCSKNGMYEDPTYCNTYHRCLNSVDEHFICENQLLYNPLSTLCDYPINVACGKKQLLKRSYSQNTEVSKNELSKAEIKHNLNSLNAKSASLIQSKVSSKQENSKDNNISVVIHGAKINLNCPAGAKNALIPDNKYCNVFHHCHGGTGNVFICEKGQAFDGQANGPEKSGVCNFEEMVNCVGKFILTENGQKPGQPRKNPAVAPEMIAQALNSGPANSKSNMFVNINNNNNNNNNNYVVPPVANIREETIMGVSFDCRGKANGHWRDLRYCDVFHACIGGEQRKTYSCAQLGERVYFDEISKRCEFSKNNQNSCPNNQYYQQVTVPNVNQGIIMDEPADAWKAFIRSREQFVCTGKSDGFYASRWCNVFYRCFVGIKSEFLCPKMMNSDRLWWVQHGTSQETAQTSAACVWPCETKKQCTSPGGVVVESSNGMFTESISEANRIWGASNCVNDPSVNDIFRIPDQDFSCAGRPEGSFQPSKYCNVFHRCTNGQRKDFQCAKATNSPYDLWWNAATSQCDWPCKITCTKPVYGSQKSAQQIQSEDRSLNEEECRGFQGPTIMVTPAPVVIPSRPIPRPYPDDPYTCPGVGLFISPKICNVYYECRGAGQAPVNAFYCENGFFDNVSKQCRPQNQVQCPYNPQTVYPLLPIPEGNTPEDVACSTFIGTYIIHSNRFCNLYYACDGVSSEPQTFRCYDRQNLEDAVYNKETKRCESIGGTSCQGEILPLRTRYQSSPVDHTRLPELQPLSCRADQQYLAEHDRFCNLYHSCILGRYQMYACVTIGGFNSTSYFYYTNGDCSAPNDAQCGPNKSIFPYDRLFPGNSFPQQNFVAKEHNYFLPVIAPSMAYSGQANFGYVTLKNVLEPLLECESTNNYYIPHKKFCNLFYECNAGKLKINICMDQSTNLFAGIFDKTTGRCKPFNMIDCPSNAIYNPENSVENSVKSNNNSVEAIKSIYHYDNNVPFNTESKFSCMGRQNGYYESEWCNVFFRCLNGKRIDTKCGAGHRNGELVTYDLWWEHQNVTYDIFRPKTFFGSDEDAKCEWPCRVKCNKQIWTPNGLKQSSETIASQDLDKHPGCSNENTISYMYFNAGLSASNNNIFKPYETENSNPSGFFCETDGIFKDPLFCNIYHTCSNKQRRTFHCKQYETDGTGKFVSIYSVEKNACVSREEGLPSCNGLIYDPNYMNLPAYKDLPSAPRICDKVGVYRAVDRDSVYCDLFYWCEKLNAEPLFFQCNAAVFGKGVAFFNPEMKQCDSSINVNCAYPNKLYSNALTNQIPQPQGNLNSQSIINGLGQPSPYVMQIVAGLLDPAPGYLSLPPNQFQTSFNCQGNAPGYYPNPEYCDLFHYCYANGQFKTYVCASMQNRYQLWWSHQTEPGRRDNIFCDWPCNMVGPNTICPAHKRVLMRDRQQISGGIAQQEVIQSTCPNTGPIYPPSTTPPPMMDNWQNFWQTTQMPKINQQPLQNSQQNAGNMNGYPPCTKSMDWFISPQTIRCSSEYRLHGFAPDPRDCSKYYRCDHNIGYDNMATGYLMSCIAGLWWDQSRRMCVSPLEVSCDPYNIINSQGMMNSPVYEYQVPVTTPDYNQFYNGNYNNNNNNNNMFNNNNNMYNNKNNNNNDNNNKGNGGSPCKFLTCAQAGLSMKNFMKSIPGRLGGFYKCDGQCAVEMTCPMDLVFDDNNQRCEWIQSQARMASLRAAENVLFVKNNIKQNNSILDSELNDATRCNCTTASQTNKNDLKTLVNNDKKGKDQSVKTKNKI